MADQQKIKKLEKILEENQYKAEQKIRDLVDALDAQRRKSLIDEKKVQDFERIINEKIYFLNELTRRKSEDEKQLKLLR